VKRLLFLLVLITAQLSFGQEDLFGLIDATDTSEKRLSDDLLPERMLFTQKILWGEKGLMRKTGIAPLSREQRVKELQWRKSMLTAHQAIGYITLAGMIAQGVIGGELYNGNYDLKDTHEALGNFVTASYFTGAALSLFSPPPLISARKEGISGARAHKWLATVHLSAMIATQYYKERDKSLHRAAAYTAVGAFATATLVLRLD
jgi:hypothetical protein